MRVPLVCLAKYIVDRFDTLKDLAMKIMDDDEEEFGAQKIQSSSHTSHDAGQVKKRYNGVDKISSPESIETDIKSDGKTGSGRRKQKKKEKKNSLKKGNELFGDNLQDIEELESDKDQEMDSEVDQVDQVEQVEDSGHKMDIEEGIAEKKELWRRPWMKYGEYQLSNYDREVINRETEWMTDTIINTAQFILLTDYPDIGGLQNVLLNEISGLQPVGAGKLFVQILFNGGNHWIVVSNRLSENPTRQVKVYDSRIVRDRAYSIEVARAICKLMAHTPTVDITICFPKQQKDNNQCGVYAIAFAQALCAGQNPCDINYVCDAQTLRHHLNQCFEKGHITRFPTCGQITVQTFRLCRKDFITENNQIEKGKNE